MTGPFEATLTRVSATAGRSTARCRVSRHASPGQALRWLNRRLRGRLPLLDPPARARAEREWLASTDAFHRACFDLNCDRGFRRVYRSRGLVITIAVLPPPPPQPPAGTPVPGHIRQTLAP